MSTIQSNMFNKEEYISRQKHPRKPVHFDLAYDLILVLLLALLSVKISDLDIVSVLVQNLNLVTDSLLNFRIGLSYS